MKSNQTTSSKASNDRLNTDVDQTLVELGKSLVIYRKQVLKYTQQEFIDLLNISEPTLRKMEKGDPGVSIGIWLRAFKIMQVDKSVLSASRPDHLILASMFGDIEDGAKNKSSS